MYVFFDENKHRFLDQRFVYRPPRGEIQLSFYVNGGQFKMERSALQCHHFQASLAGHSKPSPRDCFASSAQNSLQCSGD